MTNTPGCPHVGLVELSTHENFLADLCSIAGGCADVTVFTTGDIRDRVSGTRAFDHHVEWVVPDADEDATAFLSTVEAYSRTELDVLWSFPLYGTVLDYLRYARFDPGCPFVLSAYDLNGLLGKRVGFTPKVYNYVKYPLKRHLLATVDTLAVEFDPIRDYVERHVDGSVETFTPVFYDGDAVVESGDGATDLVLTVPGMIDETRRDYDVALDSIRRIANKLEATIEVVLLGRPVGDYGDRIVSEATAIDASGVTITTFDGWISTETFAEELARSDLLLSPLRQTRQIDGFVEVYGHSKGSGAISDAIRHATPLVLPAWYDVPERITPGVTTFESPGNLADIVRDVADDPAARARLSREAQTLADEYTLSEQRSRFRDVLDTAMEH